MRGAVEAGFRVAHVLSWSVRVQGVGEAGFRVAHVLSWSARVQGAGEAGFRAGGPTLEVGSA